MSDLIRPTQIDRRYRGHRVILLLLALLLGLTLLAGCSRLRRDNEPPTPAPLPTYTPTPIGFVPENAVVQQEAAPAAQPAAAQAEVAAPVPTQAPATEAPVAQPTATPQPPTPTAEPTASPMPTETPTPDPTATPIPPTATPDFEFELVESDRFPLADGDDLTGVRISLYIYGQDGFPLSNYGVVITHNDEFVNPREVDTRSRAGLPQQTRPDPGPYTRFTNLSLTVPNLAQGTWTVQAVDSNRVAVGQMAAFIVGANDENREFYLRYQLK